jgi:ribosome maturation protein SDO1
MSKGYTVARINIDGNNFELVVKPEQALSYREGIRSSISDVLVSDLIFSDANKGLKVAEKDLMRAFNTIDVKKIAEIIIKKGFIQLTTEQRKKMTEEKQRQIIAFIARQAIDPRTKLPHPPTRIEQALEQIHFSVDLVSSIEEQAKKVIEALRPILPISIEKITVSVRITPQYAGRSYGTVKSFGTIKSESWNNDGSWSALIEMPAGLYGPFLEKLGDLTKGNIEAEIIK